MMTTVVSTLSKCYFLSYGISYKQKLGFSNDACKKYSLIIILSFSAIQKKGDENFYLRDSLV